MNKLYTLLTTGLVIAGNTFGATDNPDKVDDKVWLNNKLGLGHEVPPPWTPLQVKDNTVKVWGREIILDGSGFPSQVINQGQPMLCAPLTLKAVMSDGKTVSFKPDRVKLVKKYPDEAIFAGNSSAAGISAKLKTTVEFDGFMKFELTLGAADNVKVKQLYLDCPLRPDQMKYYISPFRGYSPMLIMDTWGTLTKKRKFKFYNTFSLTGTDVSWNWSCDAPENWRLQRRSRALEVIPSEDEFTFRVNFIDAYAGVKVGKERKIVFALQPGPFRPPLKNYRRYTALWWEAKPALLKRVAATGLKPMVCLWPFSMQGTVYKNSLPEYARASRVGFSYPWPEDPKAFRTWMKETQAAGGLVCPYINTDNFNLDWGAGKKYQAQWAGAPIPEKRPPTKNGFRPKYGQAVCYHAKSLQDFYVWLLVRAMQEFGYDGYYSDNTWSKACKNPAHPASHQGWTDEDGRKWPRIPLLETRNYYKRIYKAIKKIKPDALFFVNGGGSPLSFWDFRLTAEYLSRVAGSEQLWSEFVKPEDMKGGFFRGHQFGTMPLAFPQCAGKNLSAAGARSLLSILVMGDTVTQWEVTAHQLTLVNFDKLKGAFKIWEADWVPFWKSGSYLNCASKNVYLTLYKKPDAALIFVSNPNGGKTTEVKVSVDLAKVFPRTGSYSAFDPESDKAVPLTSAMVLNDTMHMFTVQVKPHDFRAVVITKK